MTAAPLFYFLPHWGVAVNSWGERPDFGQVLGVRCQVSGVGCPALPALTPNLSPAPLAKIAGSLSGLNDQNGTGSVGDDLTAD